VSATVLPRPRIAARWLAAIAAARAWLFLVVLIIGFEIWSQVTFGASVIGNAFNIRSIAVFATAPLLLLLAMGQTFVTISGGIDLSVGFTMGFAAVVLSHTVNVATDALGREPMRRVFGIPVIDRRRMREEAARTLDALDIGLGRPVREPTAALGVPEQRKVIALIQSLKAHGVGVVFIAHNLADIFAVADRIAVLRRGVVVGERARGTTEPDEVVRLMIG
jgi:ribose/xylose/arabinose/galactoside ABC-type transport system permease subunit